MLIELYKDQEADYTFDFTAGSAVEMCPTWGIVRYIHGLTPVVVNRQMALECGSVMHECFAAVRWLDALRNSKKWELDEKLLQDTGERLFSADRLESIEDNMHGLDPHDDDDCRTFVVNVLYTSGYEEDDRDQRRTLFNMEVSILAYMNRWTWDRWMPWTGMVPIHGRMERRLGIEIPMDLYIEVPYTDYEPYPDDIGMKRDNVVRLHYTGRMDGLHYDTLHGRNTLVAHENKTTMRLGDAWESGMMMSHQITGYVVGASLISGLKCNSARAIGLSIPWPTDDELYHGYLSTPCKRDLHHVQKWEQWLQWVCTMLMQYAGTPADAPRFTHSCNRFFRPCSMIPLCDEEDFDTAFDELEYMPWSPLDPITQQD